MAERRNNRDVCLEYTFDRLLVAKLEQVYRTLVPDRVRVIGEPAPQAGGSKLIGAGDEDGGDLRPGILGQAIARPKTVGGSIAIAAITKHEGFQWVQQRNGFGRTQGARADPMAAG